MIRLWQAFVARMDTREGGEALAALRVALGTAALATALHNWPVGTMVWTDVAYDGYRSLPGGPWLVELLGGTTPEVVTALMVTTIASALLVIGGVVPRLAALVYLQAHMALSDINGHAGGSYDELLSNVMWILVFARSHATWSLTCRLRTGRWSDRSATVLAWPRYLIVLQLVIVYTSTGLQKVSAHWIPFGDLGALYYILQQPSWAHWPDMTWLAWWFPVTQAMTLGVWLFEVGAPLLLVALWARGSRTTAGPLRRWLTKVRFRDLFGLFGIGMHIGIHALMAVGPFSIISLAMYPALWHADEWRRLSDRLSGRLRRSAPPSPQAATPHRAG